MVAHLPELEPQYRMMVQSLDNTRHHMKTSGVVVPPEGMYECVRMYVVCECVCCVTQCVLFVQCVCNTMDVCVCVCVCVVYVCVVTIQCN